MQFFLKPKHKGFSTLLIIFLALFLVLTPFQQGESIEAYGEEPGITIQNISDNLDYVPGQLIVKYKPGLQSLSSVQSAVYETDGIVVESLASGTQLLQVAETEDIFQIAEELEENPYIEYVEPNYIVRAFDINNQSGDIFELKEGILPNNLSEEPNDTYFSQQYGLKMINAPTVWSQISSDEDVTVAVIDTGVDNNHPDLFGRVLTGHNFVDKNSRGISYNSDVAYDDHGHGTHVSGIIAGITNNQLGIASVVGPGNVKILPLKMLDDTGRGTSFNLAKAIRNAGDQGAKIINLSLGSNFATSVERDAIAYVQDLGCLVIAAAGNESSRVEYTYPASYPGVMSVAAVDRMEKPAWFSNYGPTLDISAPGVDILSTLPAEVVSQYQSRGDKVIGDRNNGYYVAWSGTSMATPHVVGVAALYKLAHPGASPLEISEMLALTAKDIGEIGRDSSTGYGLVDAAAVLGKEPERRALAFISPREGSNVYGTVNISFQIGIPQETGMVDFYLEEICDDNKLISIECNPDKTGYSWEWDTREKPDGEYSIIGVARDHDGQVLGNESGVPLKVKIKNEITNGLALEIKTPDGEVASSARAYVFTQDGINGDYKMLGHYYANDSGYVRTLEYAGIHENGYEVFVLGKTEQETGGTKLFLYRRHFDTPGRYTIDASETVETSINMQGASENLNNVLFCIAPLDRLQNHIGVLGPIEGTNNNNIYLDKGSYDFYGYWNPARDKTGNEKATYLLTERQNIEDTTTEVNITTTNAGKVIAFPQANQDKTILYLKNDTAGEIWGIPFIDNSLTGQELIVTAGDYNVRAQVEKKDKDGIWTYYLEKDEVISVPANLVSPVEVNFGGTLQISQFEPLGGLTLNKGETLKTENKFTDDTGNLLTRLNEPSPYSFISNYALFMLREGEEGEVKINAFNQEEPEIGFQEVEQEFGKYIYPTFKIYDQNQKEIYSYSTWAYFTDCRWNSGRDYSGDLPPQPGTYTAVLTLEAGPLVDGGILEKSFDLELVVPDGMETLDVVINGRDGVTPIPAAKVDIYTWNEEPGESSGNWQRIKEFTADNNGVVHLERNLALNPEGKNFVVVRTARNVTAKGFADINELNKLDFTNTGKVDLRIYDKNGNRQIEKIKVPLYHQGKVVTEVTMQIDRYDSHVYLDYGVHPYIYSMFNQGISTYLIGKENFAVDNNPDDLPVLLELGGRNIAQLGVTASSDLSSPIIKLQLANPQIVLPEINAEYTKQLYISPGIYQAEVVMNDINAGQSFCLNPGASETVALEAGNNYQWQFSKPISLALKLDQTELKGGGKLTGQVLIKDEYDNSLKKVTQGSSVINPIVRIYKVEDDGTETLVEENNDSQYYDLLAVVLPDISGTYRAEVSLEIAPNNILKTPKAAEYQFTISEGSIETEYPLYQLNPITSQLYNSGITLDGVKMMTLKNGVTGNAEFTVEVKPIKEHIGEETIVFVHLRNGIQIGLNQVRDDFDQTFNAKTAFIVKAGDIIKVYMVDNLNTRLDLNPLVMH